jgi:SNF2 family DNA or RNA helicase
MGLLKKAFPSAAYIIGGMTAKARDAEVDKFETGETNTIIGNIDAAGESITLTRSRLLAFAEMDWRGTQMIQARKRIHRITQSRECSGFYLASANSFDALVAESAFEKMENIKETLDI